MKASRLVVQDKIVLTNLQVADTFLQRFRGLMGKTLGESEGLLIKPCNSIHCFFMRIPIDVIFLNESNEVVHKIEKMRPWTVSPIVKGSKTVIEASAGAFQLIKIGDRVMIE